MSREDDIRALQSEFDDIAEEYDAALKEYRRMAVDAAAGNRALNAAEIDAVEAKMEAFEARLKLLVDRLKNLAN